MGARRTPQWYGRGSPVRRGGGTGRRVGLKNRCPQGRASSTLALGTKAPELSLGLPRFPLIAMKRADELIKEAVGAWPGVEAVTHRSGGKEDRSGGKGVAHFTGDAVVGITDPRTRH